MSLQGINWNICRVILYLILFVKFTYQIMFLLVCCIYCCCYFSFLKSIEYKPTSVEAARKRLRDKLGDKNYQITPRKLLAGSYIQDRRLRISFLLILIKLFLFSFFLVQIFENIQNIKEFLAC